MQYNPLFRGQTYGGVGSYSRLRNIVARSCYAPLLAVLMYTVLGRPSYRRTNIMFM